MLTQSVAGAALSPRSGSGCNRTSGEQAKCSGCGCCKTASSGQVCGCCKKRKASTGHSSGTDQPANRHAPDSTNAPAIVRDAEASHACCSTRSSADKASSHLRKSSSERDEARLARRCNCGSEQRIPEPLNRRTVTENERSVARSLSDVAPAMAVVTTPAKPAHPADVFPPSSNAHFSQRVLCIWHL